MNDRSEHPAARGLMICLSSPLIAEALRVMGHEAEWASIPGRAGTRVCWSTAEGAAAAKMIVQIDRAVRGIGYLTIAQRLAADPGMFEAFNAVYNLDGNIDALAGMLLGQTEPDPDDRQYQAFLVADAVCKGLAKLSKLLDGLPSTMGACRNINEAEWRLASVRDGLVATPLPTAATPEGEPIP